LETAQGDSTLNGTTEYPRIFANRFVTPDSFLFDRIDESTEASKRHLNLHQGDLDFPLDFGLGKVLVSVLTAIHGRTIYGEFSFGRSDGWVYHTFSYDLDSRRTAVLACPPVAIVSSTGDLATKPEVTDVKNGDYSTVWSKQVKLFPVGGKQRLLTWNGQTQFEVLDHIGDALVVKTNSHFEHPKYVAFDFRGEELPNLTAFLATAVNVQSFLDGNHGLIQVYNRREGRYSYVWIEAE
jgi:hypothetical protein